MDAQPFSLVGIGLYSIPEASRLTKIPSQSIRRWLKGYRYPAGSSNRYSSPLWVPEVGEIDDSLTISFLDLMELRIVREFRGKGVSLQAIRIAIQRASNLFARSHPLTQKRLLTDGRSIFAQIAQEQGDPELVDLVSSQYAFERVLRPSLYASMAFDSYGDVICWYPLWRKKSVVLDPGRSFGRPIVAEGVPTEILTAAYAAEQNLETVARWYDVPKEAVKAAIDFEQQIAA